MRGKATDCPGIRQVQSGAGQSGVRQGTMVPDAAVLLLFSELFSILMDV
jgi:hypothetical protein